MVCCGNPFRAGWYLRIRGEPYIPPWESKWGFPPIVLAFGLRRSSSWPWIWSCGLTFISVDSYSPQAGTCSTVRPMPMVFVNWFSRTAVLTCLSPSLGRIMGSWLCVHIRHYIAPRRVWGISIIRFQNQQMATHIRIQGILEDSNTRKWLYSRIDQELGQIYPKERKDIS